MASVCGGAMSMMDAGVPLKAPVAGVAMGLVMDEKTGKWAVLSDIAGAEDHYGDMDFKVAGTATGPPRGGRCGADAFVGVDLCLPMSPVRFNSSAEVAAIPSARPSMDRRGSREPQE